MQINIINKPPNKLYIISSMKYTYNGFLRMNKSHGYTWLSTLKYHAVAPSNAMIRKARESWLDTLLCEKEINVPGRHIWPIREACGWRAGFLVLTSQSSDGKRQSWANECVALQ